MPNIDLSILNQRQTPAFYASSLATRPAFGFAGRIFIDTDSPSTGLYRDTGAAWVQIADPGAGTTGTLQQVTTNGNTTTLRIIGQSFQGNAADGDYFLKSEDVEFRNQAISDSFRLVGGGNPSRGYIYFGSTGTNYLGYDGTNLVLNSSVTIPSLTSGSVAFIGASGLISQDNTNFFWDDTNNRLGINTNTPGTALDVHNNTNTILQLNQTVATNDTRIAFQNSGSALWRIGNLYNAGANDFEIFDVVGSIQSLTVKKTTGQVLIGTSTVGSGKLVVSSANSDNGVQIVGAAAPSLRIDNAASGPTKRAGLGISTATNNFIQGSADRDFCMFNGSTTASPILFGIYDTTNVQEAARISAARNFLIGTTTDNGAKFQVSGSTTISTSLFIGTNNSVTPYTAAFKVGASGSTFFVRDNAAEAYFIGPSIGYFGTATAGSSLYLVSNNGSTTMVLSGSNNVLIGTTTDAGQKLQVSGNALFTSNVFSNSSFIVSANGSDTIGAGAFLSLQTASGTNYQNNIQLNASGGLSFWNYSLANGWLTRFTIKNSGVLNIASIPTSAAGLVSGDIYSNAGILTIVP